MGGPHWPALRSYCFCWGCPAFLVPWTGRAGIKAAGEGVSGRPPQRPAARSRGWERPWAPGVLPAVRAQGGHSGTVAPALHVGDFSAASRFTEHFSHNTFGVHKKVRFT